MEMDGVYIASGAVSTIAGVVITYLKMRKTQPRTIENDPLNVNKLDKYVTRGEFNRHVEQNAAEHKAMVDDRERNYEALYNRQLANDKLTSEIKGKLDGIKDDLSLIKNKLFKTR